MTCPDPTVTKTAFPVGALEVVVNDHGASGLTVTLFPALAPSPEERARAIFTFVEVAALPAELRALADFLEAAL